MAAMVDSLDVLVLVIQMQGKLLLSLLVYLHAIFINRSLITPLLLLESISIAHRIII